MPRPRTQKVCEACGDEYWPNSGIQKRCDDCRASGKKSPASKRPKPKPVKQRRHEVRAGVANRLGHRLAEIERESFERFRGEA